MGEKQHPSQEDKNERTEALLRRKKQEVLKKTKKAAEKKKGLKIDDVEVKPQEGDKEPPL